MPVLRRPRVGHPRVDLVYYGRQGQLEYDFIVAPGQSPDRIGLAFEGISKLELDERGNLKLHHLTGVLRFEKPVVYQEVSGARKEIAGSYVLKQNDRVGFKIAAYDKTQPLIIDPVLSYSSYLGGGGQDAAAAIAVDSQGQAYVTGATSSLNFPSPGAPAKGFAGGGILGTDGFVAKLNADGSGLVYSTYFGGSDDEFGMGITVDAQGNAYVTGATRSTDFPTQNPVQASFGGAGEILGSDGFVFKLNPDGSGFVYSTYLGGAADDGGRGIAVDVEGNAYVAGSTSSINFPTAKPLQPANLGGAPMGSDAFVAKLNADGSALLYSTYLGGSGDDLGMGIAVDAAGNAYVTGSAGSQDFPGVTPIQQNNGGAVDAFVTKVNMDGSVLLYSTLLGGASDDYGMGIALDPDANAYVTGLTGSPDFPLVGAAQPDFGGVDGLGVDAFVAKLNAAGSELVYSTFLGGSDAETASATAVDAAGNAYVTGETGSSDFPTMNAIQPNFGGVLDGFVAKLDATGSSFEYCTYLGGSGQDVGSAIAVDAAGNAYVAAGGTSLDSPTTFGAFQTSSAGPADALIVKIVEGEPPPAVATILAASGSLLVAPGSIASGFGDPLAAGVEVSNEFPLPTDLLGVSVRVTDSAGAQRLAQLFVVTPAQINFVIDPATTLGLALIEVLQDGEVIATGTVQVVTVAPGIFTANADGEGVPAALYLRFRGAEQTAQEFLFDPTAPLGAREPLLIDFGEEDEQVFIAIFATGMRRGSAVTATIDGEDVPVSPVVALEQFVGLDQANVGAIPRSFIGRGVVELRLFIDGIPTNEVLLLL